MKHLLLGVGRLILFIVAFLLFWLGLQNSAFAEGTKQVRPDSTVSAAALIIDWDDPNFTRFCMLGCAANYRLNIHIKTVGEKILFGLKTPYNSPTPITYNLRRPDASIAVSGTLAMSGAGYIQYYRQATIGPFPASGGYTPISVTSNMTGDWYFEITQVGNDALLADNCARFDLWDFQVVNGVATPQPSDTLNGRVWSQSWQLYSRLPVNWPPTEYFSGSFYVYTDDGIVTKLVCNGMYMGEGTFFCNSIGATNTGTFAVDRQSKNSNTFVGFPAIAGYKVFLNNPDTVLYPNGVFGILNSVTFHNDTNAVCSWNKFLEINVNKAGQVVIKIDVPYGDPSYDVFIIANVVPGNNTIPWNGLDGHNNPVPNGTILTITVDYLNGLTNLPLWDFEANPNGYKVYPVRPLGPGLLAPLFYWDDSQLTGTSTCSTPPTTVNLTGCNPAGSVCHDWPTQVCHDKMINTWWYSGSTSTAIAVTFNSQPIPTITGPAAVCSSTVGSVYVTEAGMSNYTWTVSAGGTITAGGGLTDNTVTVTWGAAGARTVTVSYTGTNGCPSLLTTKNVTVATTLAVSVTIAASSNPVCPGTSVTYTATPTNGGTVPAYQWKVNGANQGTNSPTFVYTPTNGNTISCVLTSNLSCATGNPATSNVITMTVLTPLPVSVTIAASSNPVCAGNPVTYTAIPTNGGASPSYQWKVNGVNSGTNSNTFIYYPSNGDQITCVITSSLPCAAGIATSNTITMTVNARPIPTLSGNTTVCAGSTGNVYTTETGRTNYIWVVSAGGTITAGGGTTNNTVTITWNTAGAQTVSVNYTRNGCNAVTPTVLNVTVNPRPVPTITGPSSACNPSSGNIYTTEPGMSAYVWTVSAGGTINSGAGTSSISVTWSGTGAQTVTVRYTNSFGCTTASPTVYNVNVNNNLPVSIAIAASANPVCAGTSVTFTATPTNGGSTPAYQWKVNGANQGTNSPTYSYTPVNGDVITCVLTSNMTCVTGNPATSNAVTMTINPLLPVSVSIAASANPICAGTSVIFTATPINGGTTPSYQWKVNGVNQGTNSPTYSYTPVNGQTITCVLTSNATCPTGNPATSNAITMTVDPILPVSVSISASANPVCAGTSVTFTATPVNGGTTPAYQWKVNGANQGTSSPTYSYTPVTGDVITCVLTSNHACVSGNPATSNAITMTVDPILPVSVSIAASANPVCTGTSVTFTATPTNGGTTPAYQWKVNGANQGTNSPTYSYTPVNGDVITCVLTSNHTCVSGNPATSNVITMTVDPILPVSVSIAASANPVCAGTSVTFTATPTNGGTTPAYQWKVNGANQGTNSPTYSYTPVNGDVITCVLTSNHTCVSGNPATSNAITMTVDPILPVSVSIAASANPVCAGTSVTFTATPTNGGSAPAYQWKVNGVNQGTNTPTYSYTPINGDIITCVLTSSLTCVSGNPATSNTITMTVNPLPVPSITGPTPVALNSTGNVYTTQAGMTNYIWTVSSGGVITAGGGTSDNTVTVTWTVAGAQTVSVTYTNSNGCIGTGVFDVMVLIPPDITCPADMILSTEPGLCSASADPGFPTLNAGTLPVSYTWVMTGATTGSGSGPILPNPYTFNLGVTTITWTATNIIGTDVCIQTVTVVDNEPPQFIAPTPKTYCVEDIYLANYWDPTMDITPDRPEYYLFVSGNTDLNLNPASFTDNCPLTCAVEIRWRITFSDGTFLPALPSLYISGQPSAYPANIQFPGSVTGNIVHIITYQIVDCHGNASLPVSVNITITPRPNVIKQP
jgi:hypothetical protein